MNKEVDNKKYDRNGILLVLAGMLLGLLVFGPTTYRQFEAQQQEAESHYIQIKATCQPYCHKPVGEIPVECMGYGLGGTFVGNYYGWCDNF